MVKNVVKLKKLKMEISNILTKHKNNFLIKIIVKTSSGAATRSSWKGSSSSGYPSSSRHEETSSSKHSHASGHSGHSHSRDSRYRNSPYTRPSK